MATLMQKALTPPAKMLERDDMALLGIDWTSQIARWWNRSRRPLIDLRRRWYEERFDGLLDENGWPGGERRIELEDGFYLDTSNTLPHLDRLLDEMNGVIEERGLQKWEDLGKPYLQNILPEDAPTRYPSLVDFGTSSTVISVVAPAY
jgi:hypothetical protein